MKTLNEYLDNRARLAAKAKVKRLLAEVLSGGGDNCEWICAVASPDVDARVRALLAAGEALRTVAGALEMALEDLDEASGDVNAAFSAGVVVVRCRAHMDNAQHDYDAALAALLRGDA